MLDNIKAGEIPNGQSTANIDGLFIEVVDGRSYYVPEFITVFNDPEFNNLSNGQGEKMSGSFKLDPNTGNAIESTARIKPSAVLGNRCIVGANTIIEEYVWIGSNVFIGDRVRIALRCEIDDNAIVGRKSTLSSNCSIGPHALVGSRCEFGVWASVPEMAFVEARTILRPHTRFHGKTRRYRPYP